jgi:hypothetical protein
VSPFALPGFVAFFVVALVVGLRLVGLAARTRQLPELLMGVGVLGIGPVGFGGIVAAMAVAPSAPGASRALAAAATGAVAVGVAAKSLFNWRIYRPGSRVAATACGLGIAGLVAAFALEGAATGFSPLAWQGSGWHLLRSALQVGCLLWGASEALVYWGKMRRRVKLGIADPLLANRFLLWGVGAGAAGLGSAIGVVAQVATGSAPLQQTWVTMSSSLHGLVSACALWLAFVPPRAYREWLRGGAAAP